MDNSGYHLDKGRQETASNRSSTVCWLIVVTCMIVLASMHAAANARHLHGISQLYDRSEALGLPSALVTQRQFAMDTYMWNVLASRAGESEGDGFRHTLFDNAPTGRSVFWTPAYTWFLRALGVLRNAFVPGESFTAAVFAASLWSNLVLLALGMIALSLFYLRRFGASGACALLFAMALTPGFYEVFLPGYADHHASLVLLLLGLCLGLLAGGLGFVKANNATLSVLPPPLSRGRSAMVVSALCGASAMAISALSTVIFLCALGLAVLAFFATAHTALKRTDVEFVPALWRVWGAVGGFVSFMLYLASYFPWAGLGRLEVNHPAYALAWWGGGEVLGATGSLLAGSAALDKRTWLRLAISVILLAMPLLAFLFFGQASHVARDPLFAAIAQNIVELHPLSDRLTAGTLDWKTALGPSPALVFSSAMLLFWGRRFAAYGWLVLVFLLVLLAAVTTAQIYQTRWGVLTAPVMVVLAAWCWGLACTLAARSRKPQLAFALISGAALLVILVFGEHSAFRESVRYSKTEKALAPTAHDLYALMMRDIATTIRQDAAQNSPTILASPSASLLLASFAEGRTLGTLYWENTQGLRKAAEILCTHDAGKAGQLIKKFGVTHIVLIQGDLFLEEYKAALKALGIKELPEIHQMWPYRALAQDILPDWATRVDYPPNAFTHALGRSVVILRVKR